MPRKTLAKPPEDFDPYRHLYRDDYCILTADDCTERVTTEVAIARVGGLFGTRKGSIAGWVMLAHNRLDDRRPILSFMMRRVDAPPTAEFSAAIDVAELRGLVAALQGAVQAAEVRGMIPPEVKR